MLLPVIAADVKEKLQPQSVINELFMTVDSSKVFSAPDISLHSSVFPGVLIHVTSSADLRSQWPVPSCRRLKKTLYCAGKFRGAR